MDKQLDKIRQQQKESWNKFSPGWKKWDGLTMDFLRPIGDEMVDLIDPGGDDVILDVAAGTGEPGLTMAAKLDGGKVIIADLAEDMLEIARQNALDRGLDNVETRVCDVSELPFEDGAFDAVSCRLGFMFFPDMSLAVKEMARVLKPGGKITASVWGAPDKNPWVTTIVGAIKENIEMPTPPPGAPGMFRCAKPGLMVDLFNQAGLKNISEEQINGKLNSGTAEDYWNMMTEVAAPIVAALNKADKATVEKIKQEVAEKLEQKYPEGEVALDSSAIVVYGEK